VKTEYLNIQLPLTFSQVVELIKQLPYSEKQKLSKLLKEETMQV